MKFVKIFAVSDIHGHYRILKQALEEAGFEIGNVDATVIAQRPKLAPYLAQMQERIAAALGCAAACVRVKATTEEKMGFTGDGTGISAHAVCIVAHRDFEK